MELSVPASASAAVILQWIAEVGAAALPTWMYGLVVITLLVICGLPRVLRALDERRIIRLATKMIKTEAGAVEALRILRHRDPPSPEG
jgi:hypothetical protein